MYYLLGLAVFSIQPEKLPIPTMTTVPLSPLLIHLCQSETAISHAANYIIGLKALHQKANSLKRQRL